MARLVFRILGLIVLVAGIWAVAPRGSDATAWGAFCVAGAAIPVVLARWRRPLLRGVVWVVDRSVLGILRTTAMACGGRLRSVRSVRARVGGALCARMRPGSSCRSSTKRKPRLAPGRRRICHLLCDPRVVRARRDGGRCPCPHPRLGSLAGPAVRLLDREVVRMGIARTVRPGAARRHGRPRGYGGAGSASATPTRDSRLRVHVRSHRPTIQFVLGLVTAPLWAFGLAYSVDGLRWIVNMPRADALVTIYRCRMVARYSRPVDVGSSRQGRPAVRSRDPKDVARLSVGAGKSVHRHLNAGKARRAAAMRR